MASRGPPPGMGPIMVLSKSKYPIFFQKFNADTTSRLAKKWKGIGWLLDCWMESLTISHWRRHCVISLAAPPFAYPQFRQAYIQWFGKTKNLLTIFFILHHFFLPFFFLSLYNIPDSKTQRTQGRQAQLGNINAARAVADIIRSTLGPRSMLKVR